ncbi:LacI family transcriptional regulator [Vibrio kyushuensis]|uniref:LacI family DNA-binding transcriptional regulator n=1 Tax=Vibrio kyushuensis TaxID=2910249 RepID=UPI003D0E3597
MPLKNKPQKVTLSTIESVTGVSKSTISRVLNNSKFVKPEIRDKVLQAIEDTGYKKSAPKLQIGMKISRITLVMGDYLGMASGFYTRLISQIKEEAKELGLAIDLVVLKNITDPEIVSKQVAGREAILLLGLDTPEVISTIQAHQTPMVIVNGSDLRLNSSSVSPDYALGGLMATQSLLDAGHRNIKLILSDYRYSLFERKAGFIRALEGAGIVFDASQHVLDLEDYAREKMNDSTLADLISSGKAGMDFGASIVLPHAIANGELKNVTAAFCVCDMVAISLIDSLTSEGVKVPSEISVIGFDDLEISSLTEPPLSTIKTNFSTLAKSAVRLLVTEIGHGHDYSVRLNTQVNLVERKSIHNLIT